MTKTCGECKHYYDYVPRKAPCCWSKPTENVCVEFEQRVITNGDKIRQMSNTELAEMLVYSVKIAGGLKFMYSSQLIDKCYHRRANAVNATVAKLKEVGNEEIR
jgi:hypothetical protein